VARDSLRAVVPRTAPVVRLAAHLGLGVQRVATDAALRGASGVPRRIEDVTPEVLSRVIGRRVSSFTVIGDTSGTTSRARLSLTGDGVPDSVFVKMSARTVGTRLIGELGRLAQTEARFYGQLSWELTAGVPRCYGSHFDPLTGRFLIVLEDLAAGPCEFPDTLHPFGPDKASLVVELLANLHATFWDRLAEAGGTLGWLYCGSADPTVPLVPGMLRVSARRLRHRTNIPVDEGRFIIENYPAVARIIDEPPHTVLHGDAHPGNCYFRDGQAGLLDWQAVRRGHPMRDVAYTLVTSMTVADRQAHQRELLEHYRRAFSASNGPDLRREEVWERYREAAAYAYVAAAVTAGSGGMQSEEIALEGLRRTVAALDDLETVQTLRKSL
jgi:Phosphotransferase enzyme family